MDIGKRLLDLRTEKNFSQGEIEHRTGLLRCYVSRVENGHTVPCLETLERWASALDVKLYELFYEGEGKPEPASPVETETPDETDRSLLSALGDVNEADKKLLLAVAGKMAKKAA